MNPLARPWTCKSSCNLEGKAPECSGRVCGQATASNKQEACREAKRDATQRAPRSCYARHCQCDCRQEKKTGLAQLPDMIALLPLEDRGRFEGQSASALLQMLGSHKSASDRATACWLLGRVLPARSTSVFREALQDNQSAVRVVAARAIAERGEVSNPDVRTLARLAREDGSRDVRRAATYALGLSGMRGAILPLMDILCDSGESMLIRGIAAEALGDLHDSRAVATLMKTAKSQSPSLRFWSVCALRAICDRRALPLLRSIVQRDRARLKHWGSVASAALEAIEVIERDSPAHP